LTPEGPLVELACPEPVDWSRIPVSTRALRALLDDRRRANGRALLDDR